MKNLPFSSLFFSIIVWIGGYILDNEQSTKLFVCPKWLFFLYGMKKSKNLPKRVVSLTSAGYQTIGLLLMFYTIVIRKIIPVESSTHDLVGLFLSMILGAIIANILYKKYKFIDDISE